MSSERKPATGSHPVFSEGTSGESSTLVPAETSVLAAPIVAITRLCVRYPVSVIFVALTLALFSVIAAAGHLGFKTSRLDLINPNSSFNQLWLEYIDEFGDEDDLIVVVEGQSTSQIIPILDELSGKINNHPQLFRSVLHGVDVSKIREKGLHYVPIDELKKIASFANDAGTIVRNHWERLNIGNSLNLIQMRLMYPDETYNRSNLAEYGVSKELFRQGTLNELDLLSRSLMQAFDSNPTYGSPWPAMQDGSSPGGTQGYSGMPEIVTACSHHETEYFIIPGNDKALVSEKAKDKASKFDTIGIALVQLVKTDESKQLRGSFVHGTEGIEKLYELINETQKNHPELHIGLTGLPVMEYDEMRLSQDAMNQASILAFVGVVCVLFLGMGGLRYPLLANVALIVGFSWTAGYILLSVGHLNILSVAFGAILIGLGSDFSVHYLSRYANLRQSVRSPSEAIVQTGRTVGPGVLTGAVTTAVAFLMAGFTEFTGIVELGIISGGGVMLCCFAAMLAIPALLQLVDGSRPMRQVSQPLDISFWIMPFFSRPKTTLLVTLAVSGALFVGIPKLWYDHNLLNLQPEGLESVELERKLLQSGGQNAWYALSIADSREELLLRKDQYAKKYPELQVTEIVSLVPGSDPQKEHYINEIAQSLAGMPGQAPIIPLSQPQQIRESLTRLANLLGPNTNVNLFDNELASQLTTAQLAGLQQMVRQIARQLGQSLQSLEKMSDTDCMRRMQDYQNAVAGDLLTRLHILSGMSNPTPPELTDLPEPFVSRFMSKNGKHLMRIYSSADIWNMDEMHEFVHKVRDIDPKATGSPLQTYESSLQMQQGYRTASYYALFAIIFLLFFDFRSLKDAVLALVPMLIGIGQTFGIMGLLNLPLNPANTIAIPLILGLGIDYGVHVIHDYRSQKGKYRLNSSTATSVLITSLTTIIGFGSLMIASHRGLQSLGRVLVIGMSCCAFCSIVLLPTLLTLWSKWVTQRKPLEQGVYEQENHLTQEFAGFYADGETLPLHKTSSPLAHSEAQTDIFEQQETLVSVSEPDVPMINFQDFGTQTAEFPTSTEKTKRLRRRNVA